MITRTLRGLGALTVLAVLLIGWPVALLALAGTVAKWLPDLSDPAGLLARPDAGGLFLLIVLALGWIAWAVWATALLVEAAAQARGIPTPRLGGLFPQHAAAALVTAVAVAFAAAPTAALAAPPASPAPTAIRAASTSVPTDEEAPLPAAENGHRDYTVAPGDTLWDIADEQLADPHRWTEIADASRSIAQPDGHHFDDPRLIRPGWTLAIPANADEAARHDPQTSAPESCAAEDHGLTLPTTPLQAPAPNNDPGHRATGTAPTPSAPPTVIGGESDHSATSDGITLPPTPLRPPETGMNEDAEEAPTSLPSTPMTAGTAAAAIDDEGRSNPAHGVLGLPNWIADPLVPTLPENAADLIGVASVHANSQVAD